jgi:hypothetical protein
VLSHLISSPVQRLAAPASGRTYASLRLSASPPPCFATVI